MAAPNFADKTVWTGDNLDILRGLNSQTVDLIYLDPPFNSNRNYSAPVGSKGLCTKSPIPRPFLEQPALLFQKSLSRISARCQARRPTESRRRCYDTES